jgi:hypothetical protein
LSHVDGNSDHNDRTNLRLLCRNCHGVAPDHKGREKLKPYSRQLARRKRYAAGKTW